MYTLVLASDPQQVRKVEGFLESIRKQVRLDEPTYNRLLVATTEAVNNGIIHGNHRDASKKVRLICKIEGHILIVRVEDEGAGIEPATLPDPLSAENLLRENGRGVFLMRSLMDSIEFEILPGGSAVVMRMKI